MNSETFYSAHLLDEEVAKKAGLNPYFPRISAAPGEKLLISGTAYYNLASNNYLGLANDPRMVLAAIEGVREYGVSMCATPVSAGYSELFNHAEKVLAQFSGLDEVLILPSGYQANNGLFQGIAGDRDMFVVDRFAHSSLVEGIRATGCKCRPFRHNDMEHLEQILSGAKTYSQVFVVSESVFSTEGKIAPFDEIVRICDRYGAIPVVDDSHGIGVLGRSGKGILEHFSIRDYQGIYTASLGKAVGSAGGMIGGKSSLMRYLRYHISHLIYSTAIMPAALKAIIKAVDIIGKEFNERSARLWGNTRRLSGILANEGFHLSNSESPIVSIQSGGSVGTLVLFRKLFEAGIMATPFIHPSVPEPDGRIRMICGCELSDHSIDDIESIIRRIASNPV